MELKSNLFFKDFPILASHTNFGSKSWIFALRLKLKNVKNFHFFLFVVVIWSKLDARVNVSRRLGDRSIFQDALNCVKSNTAAPFLALSLTLIMEISI